MELSNVIKWAVVNRLVTALAMVLGMGLVAVGFVVGFGDALGELITDPTNVDAAISNANPLITVVFFVLGFLVWQLGKTYALFQSLPKVSGSQAAEQFDHERLKSEVLEVFDDRLAEMEDDIEQTRQAVEELKRAEHAASFDEGEIPDSATAPVAASEPAAESSSSRVAHATDDGAGGQVAVEKPPEVESDESDTTAADATAETSQARSDEDDDESGFEFSDPQEPAESESVASGKSVSEGDDSDSGTPTASGKSTLEETDERNPAGSDDESTSAQAETPTAGDEDSVQTDDEFSDETEAKTDETEAQTVATETQTDKRADEADHSFEESNDDEPEATDDDDAVDGDDSTNEGDESEAAETDESSEKTTGNDESESGDEPAAEANSDSESDDPPV